MKYGWTAMMMCLVSVVVAGCAGLGKQMTDEDMIRSTVTTLKTALETKDLDLLMTTFSDDFYHPEVGGKEEGRDMLQTAIDAGYADDGEVFLDDLEITMKEDGTATVYPIDLSGPPGSVSVELTLKKEEAGWHIIELSPDGM